MKTRVCGDFGAGEQGGAAIFEQQHHRAGVIEAQQMSPADPNGTRPHAGVLRPQRQRCRRRLDSLGRPPEFVHVELDAVISRGLDHRLQAGMNLAGLPGSRRRETGMVRIRAFTPGSSSRRRGRRWVLI